MESMSPVVRTSSEPLKWVEVRQNLRTWREEGTRHSLRAREGGNFLITNKKSQLGNEGRF